MSGRCKGATIKQLYPGGVFMHQGDFSFAMPPSEVCPTTFLPYTLFVNCALSCTSTVKYFNIECSSCIVPVGGDLTKISPLKTANSIHRGMQTLLSCCQLLEDTNVWMMWTNPIHPLALLSWF